MSVVVFPLLLKNVILRNNNKNQKVKNMCYGSTKGNINFWLRESGISEVDDTLDLE